MTAINYVDKIRQIAAHHVGRPYTFQHSLITRLNYGALKPVYFEKYSRAETETMEPPLYSVSNLLFTFFLSFVIPTREC